MWPLVSSPSGRSDRRSPGEATAEAVTRQRYPGRHADAAAWGLRPPAHALRRPRGDRPRRDRGVRTASRGGRRSTGSCSRGRPGEFHLHTPAERRALLEAVIAACPGTPGAGAGRRAGAARRGRARRARGGERRGRGDADHAVLQPRRRRASSRRWHAPCTGRPAGLPLIAYTMPAMAGSQWPLEVLRDWRPRASWAASRSRPRRSGASCRS